MGSSCADTPVFGYQILLSLGRINRPSSSPMGVKVSLKSCWYTSTPNFVQSSFANEITSFEGNPISLTCKICLLLNDLLTAFFWLCRAINSKIFPAVSLKYIDDEFHLPPVNSSFPFSSFSNGVFIEIHVFAFVN